jgi:RNA 2',3'-cyclic 3'-phosphodiesterase
MIERWRCFVAVPLHGTLTARLVDAVARWSVDPRTIGLRWVEPDALHLTLAFLGDIDPTQVPAHRRSIEGVAARHSAVTVPTGRLGAFARPGSARVLWYGVGDVQGALGALAADLADALGLEAVDEPYRPHVTLARARRGWLDLRGWIGEASASAPEGRLSVAALDLMRSHLGRGPARYERLASVRLG